MSRLYRSKKSREKCEIIRISLCLVVRKNRSKGEAMNDRENIGYSELFAVLNCTMKKQAAQTGRHRKIGRLVAARAEKAQP